MATPLREQLLGRFAGLTNRFRVWYRLPFLLAMPTIQAKMDKEVRSQFDGLAHFETPKKIALLEHDFSVDSGELTPTLKVKRRVIDKNYKSVIDGLYVD